MIAWKNITTIEELETAIKTSFNKNILIFKHSTRCIISRTVLRNFELDAKNKTINNIDFYFLDLLEHRNVSNEIANKLNVEHQSPQILLISNGKCFFNASHEAIDFKELQEKI
jgi:bacillithiol system protein YtxJ